MRNFKSTIILLALVIAAGMTTGCYTDSGSFGASVVYEPSGAGYGYYPYRPYYYSPRYYENRSWYNNYNGLHHNPYNNRHYDNRGYNYRRY